MFDLKLVNSVSSIWGFELFGLQTFFKKKTKETNCRRSVFRKFTEPNQTSNLTNQNSGSDGLWSWSSFRFDLTRLSQYRMKTGYNLNPVEALSASHYFSDVAND